MRALIIAVGFLAVLMLLPSQVAADGDIVALSGGGAHTCALMQDASVSCWGLNEDGQLGDGTNGSSSTPQGIASSQRFSQIDAGLTHTCAVTEAGKALCWGENNGRLGNGAEEPSSTPVLVCADAACETELGGVVAIAAGGSHSCAALVDGSALCWGNNEDGQLGDGSTDDSLTPVAVAGLTNVTNVSLGTSSSCAMTAAGGVWCWGSNVEGQIGDDRACGMRCTAPQPVVDFESGVAQLEVGGLHACALTSAGAVLCWGFNFDGQVGDGTENGIRIVPTQVVGLDGSVTALGVGGGFRGHACAYGATPGLVCWGDNDVGQVGDGTTLDRISPVAVGLPDGAVVASFAAGDAFMCAVTSMADVYCWGSNQNGPFGDGGEVDQLTPTLVGLKSGESNPGDANCDEQITSIDAALILQHTAGFLAGLSCDGDANSDGRVDSIDAALVLQVTAGLLDSL